MPIAPIRVRPLAFNALIIKHLQMLKLLKNVNALAFLEVCVITCAWRAGVRDSIKAFSVLPQMLKNVKLFGGLIYGCMFAP